MADLAGGEGGWTIHFHLPSPNTFFFLRRKNRYFWKFDFFLDWKVKIFIKKWGYQQKFWKFRICYEKKIGGFQKSKLLKTPGKKFSRFFEIFWFILGTPNFFLNIFSKFSEFLAVLFSKNFWKNEFLNFVCGYTPERGYGFRTLLRTRT